MRDRDGGRPVRSGARNDFSRDGRTRSGGGRREDGFSSDRRDDDRYVHEDRDHGRRADRRGGRDSNRYAGRGDDRYDDRYADRNGGRDCNRYAGRGDDRYDDRYADGGWEYDRYADRNGGRDCNRYTGRGDRYGEGQDRGPRRSFGGRDRSRSGFSRRQGRKDVTLPVAGVLTSSELVPAGGIPDEALLHEALNRVLPLKAAHRRALPANIVALSRLLTVERAELKRPYWASPSLTGAYIHYFLPWNVFRLSRLFAGLRLPPPPDGGKHYVLDIGSGPLTVPIALWLSSQEWRRAKIVLVAVDSAGHPLRLGKALLEHLAASAGVDPWEVRLVQSPVAQGVRRAMEAVKGCRPWLVTAANVLNEIPPGRGERLLSDEDADRLADGETDMMEADGDEDSASRDWSHFETLLRQIDRLLRKGPEGARALFVEPGTRLGGLTLMRLRSLARLQEMNILGPCTHTGLCPLLKNQEEAWFDDEGEQVAKIAGRTWCHVTFPGTNAPRWLAELAEPTGLAKDHLSLAWLELGPSESGEIHWPDGDVAAEGEPDGGRSSADGSTGEALAEDVADGDAPAAEGDAGEEMSDTATCATTSSKGRDTDVLRVVTPSSTTFEPGVGDAVIAGAGEEEKTSPATECEAAESEAPADTEEASKAGPEAPATGEAGEKESAATGTFANAGDEPSPAPGVSESGDTSVASEAGDDSGERTCAAPASVHAADGTDLDEGAGDVATDHVLPARLVSGAFNVPGLAGRCRYACSEAGLLLFEDVEDLPNGTLLELKTDPQTLAEAPVDKRSGARMLALSRKRHPRVEETGWRDGRDRRKSDGPRGNFRDRRYGADRDRGDLRGRRDSGRGKVSRFNPKGGRRG